jgi:hypothetical protein
VVSGGYGDEPRHAASTGTPSYAPPQPQGTATHSGPPPPVSAADQGAGAEESPALRPSAQSGDVITVFPGPGR